MTFTEWVKMQKDTYGVDIDTERKRAYNEASDKRQFERYQAILGADAPQTFAEFRQLKYERPGDYAYTKGLVQYLRDHPESDKRYYDAQVKLRILGIDNGVLLPASPEQAFVLPPGKRDRYHIMHRMRERGITDDALREYMSGSKAMFLQWEGKRKTFIGDSGTCTIIRTPEWPDAWVFKSAWTKYDFAENTELTRRVLRDVGLL